MEVRGANRICGEIKVPGDKSISHRSAIISSITRSIVTIENFLFSEDCIKTIEVLKKIGVKIEKIGENLIVYGNGIESFKEPSEILDVGNSGTTIRLMSGILSATNFLSILSGDKSVNSRPMDRIIKPLSKMGAKIFGRGNNTKAPIVIFGNPNLEGKSHHLEISSAQVKSCLSLAGIFAQGETEIFQPEVSRDHTERMLEYFGANIIYDGRYTKIIPDREIVGKNIYIPGDISSATYFIVAALLIKDSYILVRDVGINPTRTYIIDLLRKMGADIRIKNIRTRNNEPLADIETFYSPLNSIEVERDKIPNIIDEIPILCVAAAVAKGVTTIRGAIELRYKESDRISAVASQFKKLGVNVEEEKDGLVIEGSRKLKVNEGVVESFDDHRIAMSLAILSLLSTGKVTILDSECINTSFPSFKYILKSVVS